MPTQPSALGEMWESEGMSVLLEHLMNRGQREEQEIAGMYEWFNRQVYHYIQQGMDVDDAVRTVQNQLQTTPGWEQMQEKIANRAPHLLGETADGQMGLVYQIPWDLMLMREQTEQQKEIVEFSHLLGIDELREKFGLQAAQIETNHDHERFMAQFLAGLDRETMRMDKELSQANQKELMRLDGNIQKALQSANIEELYEAKRGLEEFLGEMGLEHMREEHMLNLDIQSHMSMLRQDEAVLSLDHQRQLRNLDALIRSRELARIHGHEEDMKLLDEQIQERLLLFETEIIDPMRMDQRVALEEQLSAIEQQMQESLLYTKEEIQERLDKAQRMHERAMQADGQDHAWEMVAHQTELQKELIRTQVGLQFDSDWRLQERRGEQVIELEEAKDLITRAQMAIQHGNNEAMAELQGEIQLMLQNEAFTDTIVRDHLSHYMDVALRWVDAEATDAVQERQRLWEADQNDQQRELARDQMAQQWNMFEEELVRTDRQLDQADAKQEFFEWLSQQELGISREQLDIAWAELGLQERAIGVQERAQALREADRGFGGLDPTQVSEYFHTLAQVDLPPNVMPESRQYSQAYYDTVEMVTDAYRRQVEQGLIDEVPSRKQIMDDVYRLVSGGGVREIRFDPEDIEKGYVPESYSYRPDVEEEDRERDRLTFGGQEVHVFGRPDSPLRRGIEGVGQAFSYAMDPSEESPMADVLQRGGDRLQQELALGDFSGGARETGLRSSADLTFTEDGKVQIPLWQYLLLSPAERNIPGMLRQYEDEEDPRRPGTLGGGIQ